MAAGRAILLAAILLLHRTIQRGITIFFDIPALIKHTWIIFREK